MGYFEVVRLYPTDPLHARKASIDTILPVGGSPDGKSPIAVKAGTTVAYNTYLMHRREDIWGTGSWTFQPERWDGKKLVGSISRSMVDHKPVLVVSRASLSILHYGLWC